MKIAYLIEPPFNYLDDAGSVTGCDVELARYVCRELGLADIEFVQTEFADLLPGLARNDWQMTTGLFASPEREKHALFSRPIWALPDGLLVRKADADSLSGYKSLARYADHKLAVIRDQLQHKTALNLGMSPARILVFETYVDAARAVRDGRVSAFASVCRAHQGFLQQSGVGTLDVIEVPPTEKAPDFGCFAFARRASDLRSRVNQILDRFIGAPAHRRLMHGFGFSDA